MGDEDMLNAVDAQLILHKLHLCRFAAVDKKVTVLNFNKLTGGMTAICRQSTAGT